MLAALYTSELLQHQSHKKKGASWQGLQAQCFFPFSQRLWEKKKKKCKNKLDSNVVHLFQESQKHKRAMEPEVGNECLL